MRAGGKGRRPWSGLALIPELRRRKGCGRLPSYEQLALKAPSAYAFKEDDRADCMFKAGKVSRGRLFVSSLRARLGAVDYEHAWGR